MILQGCLVRNAAVLSKAITSRALATLPPEVVIFPDDQMAVCWHPEQHFPYECSKPLPEKKPQPYSVLNVTSADMKKVFYRKQSDKQIADECAKITFTTMHRWFPRSRDKKAKKTKPDRPYL